MKPKVSFPVVVHADSYNGTQEHPGMITRVWGPGDTADAPVMVNVLMFPDGGGEPQFFSSLQLFDSRDAAMKGAPGRRVAYWAANSD